MLAGALEAVMASGQWIGGAEVDELERRAAAYAGAGHCVAMGSGTDALILGMRALDIGPGDEVITTPNSFVASTASIVFAGATPVFVDVRADQNIDPALIEAAITPRTKAIMPVHLTGRMAAMDEVCAIAGCHGLKVIEDAAQAFGSRYLDRGAGTWGDIGCVSAHPLKNLNAMGDGGLVLTDDAAVAERLRRLRNNGLVNRDTVVEWGTVSRLDTLQAVILLHRLQALDGVIARRRANAELYRRLLPARHVHMEPCRQQEFNSFHTFVVQVDRRDELKQYLADHGVGTAIHYPIPIHLQPAAAQLGLGPGSFPVTEAQAGRILTLPVNQFITADEIRYIADLIDGFYS